MNFSLLSTFLAAEESALIQQEIGFVVLLSIAALVAIFVRRIRLPYTVALVIVGLILSLFPVAWWYRRAQRFFQWFQEEYQGRYLPQ